MKIINKDTGYLVADTQDERSRARRAANAPLRAARDKAEEEIAATRAREELGWFGRGGGRHRK